MRDVKDFSGDWYTQDDEMLKADTYSQQRAEWVARHKELVSRVMHRTCGLYASTSDISAALEPFEICRN